MSAIVSALSSAVISRLRYTWAHAGRESLLEPLLKYNSAHENYSYYRSVLNSVDGPCVPFCGMYLQSIVYVEDRHPDTIMVESPSMPGGQLTLIHFVKPMKLFELVTMMLRFQGKSYCFPENAVTTRFIQSQTSMAAAKADSWCWERSDEHQQGELSYSDVRKGLEAAGF